MTNNSHVVVNFDDIDTSKLSFTKAKAGNKGGSFVGIKYEGKTLFVRYPISLCPFGASRPTTQEFASSGIGLSINMPKDGQMYRKATEIDNFLIDKCIENSILWGLGGSKTAPIDRASIAGYDEYGDKGKWIRLIKHSYSFDKETKEKFYTDYDPRLSFTVPVDRKGLIKTKVFDDNSNRVEGVTEENLLQIVPKYCEVALLAEWAFIYLGNVGASLKPKLTQIRVFQRETTEFEDCMLDGDENFL